MTVFWAIAFIVLGYLIGAFVAWYHHEDKVNDLCEALELMDEILHDLLSVTRGDTVNADDIRIAIARAERASDVINETRRRVNDANPRLET